MVLKFLAKKGLGLLGKDKTKAIKSVRPGTKFKGQKTVSESKLDASKAGLDAARFELRQMLKKTEPDVKKMQEPIKKLKKELKPKRP